MGHPMSSHPQQQQRVCAQKTLVFRTLLGTGPSPSPGSNVPWVPGSSCLYFQRHRLPRGHHALETYLKQTKQAVNQRLCVFGVNIQECDCWVIGHLGSLRGLTTVAVAAMNIAVQTDISLELIELI